MKNFNFIKNVKFVFVILVPLMLASCGNYVNLKSVGVIDLDSMMVEVEPLVILTIYQNELLPDKYEEIYKEGCQAIYLEAFKEGKQDQLDQRAGEKFLEIIKKDGVLLQGYYDMEYAQEQALDEVLVEEFNKLYNQAWEEIQYIANNHVSEQDFPFSDIDNEYVLAFIQYYFDTISEVESRVVLSEPVLMKDEEKYATFTVTNTMSYDQYLIKLTPMDGDEYYIELSEL